MHMHAVASSLKRASSKTSWALAGDAGHHKEFVIGLGISDALRDARSLATAIVEDGEAALQRYWRRRDVERIEMFHWGQELGRADSVTALERLVAARVADAPEIASRFGAVIDGRLSPYELFPPSRVLPRVVAAALRGDLAPLRSLGAAMAEGVRARLELRRRRRLLTAVDARPTRTGRVADLARRAAPARAPRLEGGLPVS